MKIDQMTDEEVKAFAVFLTRELYRHCEDCINIIHDLQSIRDIRGIRVNGNEMCAFAERIDVSETDEHAKGKMMGLFVQLIQAV